jgi:hypothetical protein
MNGSSCEIEINKTILKWFMEAIADLDLVT